MLQVDYIACARILSATPHAVSTCPEAIARTRSQVDLVECLSGSKHRIGAPRDQANTNTMPPRPRAHGPEHSSAVLQAKSIANRLQPIPRRSAADCSNPHGAHNDAAANISTGPPRGTHDFVCNAIRGLTSTLPIHRSSLLLTIALLFCVGSRVFKSPWGALPLAFN